MLLLLLCQLLKYNSINSILKFVLNKFDNLLKKFFIRRMDTNKKSSNGTLTSQTIIFKAGDKQHCFEIEDKTCIIIGSTGNHDHGSSKVKLKNVVDYKWEQKVYPGRLIAVHLDNVHIAYRIKVNNRGTSEGMIRICNLENNKRTLIKGMSNEILDLQFAHLPNQIILGCIEETALHVYEINSTNDTFTWKMLLKINDPLVGYTPMYDKINWCPYVPEKGKDMDLMSSQLLVWVRGTQFQYYSVNLVVENYGAGEHNGSDIKEGCLKFTKNSHIITGATISPDGTTLGISARNGVVKFYQVYLHADEKTPRCLHEWTPHEGKPISSLFFLDNYLKCDTGNSLWKHALTGADNNTELKLWSCETWNCTQTIIFQSPNPQPYNFKADIDRSSSYLILSDMESRGLYVLQVMKDDDVDKSESSNELDIDVDESLNNTGKITLTNGAEKNCPLAFIKSIAEFPLSSPILGFGIVNAAVRRYKCETCEEYLLDELDDYDEETNSLYCVVIKMYIVQPKSLQECNVLYQPTLLSSSEVKSTLSYIDNTFDNSKTDITEQSLNISSDTESQISKAGTTPIIGGEVVKSQPSSTTTPHHPVNLMTPDSFNSSGKKSPETVSSDVMYTLFMLANATSTTSPDMNKKSIDGLNIVNIVNNKVIEEQEKEKIRKSVELQQKLSQQMAQPQNQIVAQPNVVVTATTPVSNSQTTPVLSNSTIPASNDLIASGGSSPSREVQEILSLKDSDCLNDYYDSDTVLIDDNDGIVNNDELIGNKDDDDDDDDEEELEIEDNKKIRNSDDWPKVPDFPMMLTQPPNSASSVIVDQIPATSKQFDKLYLKMDQMVDIIQEQSCKIEELRNQIHNLQKVRVEDNYKTTSNASKLEASLSNLLENYLLRFERQHGIKIDNLMKTNEKQNIQMREALLQTIPQLLYNQISERITSIFVTELQRHTLPLVANVMDNIKQQIQMDIAQKLTSCDQMLRDNIAQVCTSKTIVDSFGNSVLLGVQNGLQSTYVETLSGTLIPAYEKSTQHMLKQTRDIFLDGTKDFTKQFELYMSQYEHHNCNTDEVLEQVQLLPHEIKNQNEKLVNGFYTKIQTELQTMFKDLESGISKSIKENVKKEIENGFANQTQSLEDSVLSVVRSQAQTPAPSIYDVQEQIKQLLSQSQINKAFHQALIANDLNLVEFTIERADYNAVFNPCLLAQTVLLSLIQQITADMNHHNELKQKYLSESILNLNFRDPITKEHAPKVMKEIYQKCHEFLANHPTSSLCSGVKMLIMAVQGMGFKSY